MSGIFSRIIRTGLLSLFLTAPLVSLTGCLVATSSTERRTGNYVSSNTWDQIEAGKTTTDWVRSVIGEPSSTSHLSGGSEIWKYSYTIHKENSGGVFLIYAGDNKQIVDGTAFIEFKDNVVTRHWRDDQIK